MIGVSSKVCRKISEEMRGALDKENVEPVCEEKERGITIHMVVRDKTEETADKIKKLRGRSCLQESNSCKPYFVPRKIGKVSKGFARNGR